MLRQSVHDAFLFALSFPPGQRRLAWAETNTDQDTFPPNESYTCSASYTLTQVYTIIGEMTKSHCF